jgi:uncharacterized protein (DUF2147 family)
MYRKVHAKGFAPMRSHVLLALTVIAVPAAAAAGSDDIFGHWSRGDGAAKVKVVPCGGNICAINTWIKDPAKQNEKVGDKLIFTIKPASDQWSGSAFDPQRNLELSAKLKATGDSMETTGCIVGGLICRSTRWSRLVQ